MTEDLSEDPKRATVADAFMAVAQPTTVGSKFLGGRFKPVFSTNLDQLSEASRRVQQEHADLMDSIARDVEDRDEALERIAQAQRERQEAQDQRETEMLALTRQSVEAARFAVFVGLVGIAVGCVAIVVAIALA